MDSEILIEINKAMFHVLAAECKFFYLLKNKSCSLFSPKLFNAAQENGDIFRSNRAASFPPDTVVVDFSDGQKFIGQYNSLLISNNKN